SRGEWRACKGQDTAWQLVKTCLESGGNKRKRDPC
ncbi:unnamed protein product, partial [Tetraodon nigroviridis]